MNLHPKNHDRSSGSGAKISHSTSCFSQLLPLKCCPKGQRIFPTKSWEIPGDLDWCLNRQNFGKGKSSVEIDRIYSLKLAFNLSTLEISYNSSSLLEGHPTYHIDVCNRKGGIGKQG